MKFSLNRPVKIVMLGAGGTGGHAAPHLYRLLYALDRPVRFIICDGDTVEGKNLVRQNFTPADLGENKAKVLADRYSNVFGMESEYVPSFVETELELRRLLRQNQWRQGPYYSSKVVKEMVILLGCVDNNRSRQLCHQVFNQTEELIYIDSGNGEYTGQVVCGVRRAGKTIYPPIGEVYPDVLEEGIDKFPTQLSCAEASISAPQSMAANITAATAMVTLVYNILTLGDNTVKKATFFTKAVNLKSETQKPKKRRSAA